MVMSPPVLHALQVVRGNVRVNNWTKVGEHQIVFADGLRLRTEFHSPGDFSVENLKSKAVWKCSRIDE